MSNLMKYIRHIASAWNLLSLLVLRITLLFLLTRACAEHLLHGCHACALVDFRVSRKEWFLTCRLLFKSFSSEGDVAGINRMHVCLYYSWFITPYSANHLVNRALLRQSRCVRAGRTLNCAPAPGLGTSHVKMSSSACVVVFHSQNRKV